MERESRKSIDLEQAPDFWIYRKLMWLLIIFYGFYMGFVEQSPTDQFFVVALLTPAMAVVALMVSRGRYKKYKWSDPGIFDLRFGQMFILLALGLFLEGMLYLNISPKILELRPSLQYAAGWTVLLASFLSMKIVWSMIYKPVRA